MLPLLRHYAHPSSMRNSRCISRCHTSLLIPSMKTRPVACIPCLAESGGTQIPVWANLASHGAQVVPEVDDRWTTPEPVAVVDAVDHETRLENERVRNHRVVFGIGVLLDVEILLNGSTGIRKKGPLGSDRRSK